VQQRAVAATADSKPTATVREGPPALADGSGPRSDATPDRHGYRVPPRARWRLASPDDLQRVVLWVSEIVIRHREMTNTEVSLSFGGWQTTAPAPTRTRAEALLLAERIVAEAKQHPENFAELAEKYSEEPATARYGGSLGGIVARQFFLWPAVVDALAATPMGGVSDVVETEQGFHVLLRRQPPPEEIVSGSSIVIAHDDAPWTKPAARHPLPKRSRAEALRMASELYEKARQNPDNFAQLAREHSDHMDGDRGGDFGSWSTREPMPFPLERELLQHLRVGEIAPPLDTGFGYKILQRTANRPRREYALRRLELRGPQTEPERERLHAEARALAQKLADSPDRFGALQDEYCCRVVARVVEGRYMPGVELALEQLRVGEVAPQPVPLFDGYLIVQRADPGLLEPVARTEFELPAPVEPDPTVLLLQADASWVETMLRVVGEQATAELRLPPEVSSQLLHQHEVWGQFANKYVEEQRQVFERQQAAVRKLLGPHDYQRYRSILNRCIADTLIDITG
jgi:parvulin-like peptidyl-prolyl isomerase